MADTRSERDALRTKLVRATRPRLPRADELLDLALKRGRRRDFADLEAACPSVLSRPIQAPVFITGMPRSGTTFLHRLILQDPSTIAPRLFQLVYPHASRAGRFEPALRRRWVGLQLALFRMLSPEFNALHPRPGSSSGCSA